MANLETGDRPPTGRIVLMSLVGAALFEPALFSALTIPLRDLWG